MAAPETVFGRRRAGVLAHVSSLPGPGIQGTVEDAYDFVRFLVRSGFSVWQTLPLGPVNASGSPYQGTSVFAGNTALLRDHTAPLADDYAGFRESEAHWLEDYALYCALRGEQGGQPWYLWPADLRDREPGVIEAARMRLASAIETERREQHAFFSAWHRFKTFANSQGIYLFGDLPMFAAHDSADVWSRRELFCVDAHGRMTETAGAPPDAFATQGQDWGCPQYRWERMADQGFHWWIERLRVQSSHFDLLRLDHFRGFDASWHIPAEASSAAGGRWLPVPGEALFAAVKQALGPLPMVAEDLGHITDSVRALRRTLDLPGMHVLQFAFEGGSDNPHLPHNHDQRGVAYTGTHDNNTTLGWWESLEAGRQEEVRRYLDFPAEPMPWPLIHSALASVCALAILPLQDCLALDAEARMNTPGEVQGNWKWRCPDGALDEPLSARLRALLRLYARGV
ncbi:MAG: 4-alpha-glucanotransferase [Bacillota bacterium]